MKRLSSRSRLSDPSTCAARHGWLARGILLICLSILFASPPPARAQEIIPFSEIRTGMKGFGKTVFNGTKIDDFQVEVIGTLERIAPQRNLILVRLSGGPLANTGVLSGMSGSPVYFNDRLAGAVAYTWGFAREPVAGVTPIQEMLQVEDHETPAGGPAGSHGAMAPIGGPLLGPLKDLQALPAHFTSYFDRLPPAQPGSSPIAPTDLIMTTAQVNGFFPSLQESFKFASAGEEVGAFRQDRATGVFGYTGKRPRLIPVRLELQPRMGRSKRYSFDVVDDAFLAPYLLYAALNGILSSEEKDYGEVTLSYKPGSTIQVSGEEDIDLKNLFSGELASLYASGTVAFITQLLLNNEYHPVHVNGINLILGYYDERRTGYVERAWVSKDHVRAGETIQVSAVIKPFRGPEVTRQIDVKVPDEVLPGRLIMQVGDGLTLARIEDAGEDDEDFHPRDVAQLIWLINHLRSNDKVYAVLSRADNGILFQGQRLPNLPPSVAQVMVRPQTRGNYLRLWYRGVAEETLETDYMLTGFKQLTVDVEE